MDNRLMYIGTQAPPYYPNTFERIHCLQSSVKMAVEAFYPEVKLRLAEILFLTGNSGESLTWPLRIAGHLHKAGLSVQYIDAFNLNDFIENPMDALIKTYGPEVAASQEKGSDLNTVANDAKSLMGLDDFDIRFYIPSLDDLKNILAMGNVAICNVNSRIIKGEEGYAGHFVVVYGIDEDKNLIFVQNPGPPSSEQTAVASEIFLEAWSYSGDIYRNILGVGAGALQANVASYFDAQLKKFREFIAASGLESPTSY